MQVFLNANLPEVMVETAEDPEHALQWLKERPPAVVFADLRMRGMDGIEFLRRVRKLAPGTKCVLLTAYGAEAADILAVGEPDADLILLKPIETKPFVQRVRELVRQAAPVRRAAKL